MAWSSIGEHGRVKEEVEMGQGWSMWGMHCKKAVELRGPECLLGVMLRHRHWSRAVGGCERHAAVCSGTCL